MMKLELVRKGLIFEMILCLETAIAGGAGAPAPSPRPDRPGTTAPFILTPESLQTELLENNFSLAYGAHEVHKARLQLDQSRNALLPSLKLGMSFLSYGAVGLAFSSADFLLNFLIPSLWFDNAKQKFVMKAQEDAYLSLKLNQYNSALTSYYGLSSDLKLKQFLLEEYSDAQEMAILAEEALQNGFGNELDLEQASAQVSQSRVDYLQVDSLLVEQLGKVKQMLRLGQEREIILQFVELPESSFEDTTERRAFDLAYDKAPERQQISNLIQASKQAKWSSVFAFIQSFTASAATGADGVSTAFNDMTGRGTFDLGFTQISKIQLSQAEIYRLQMRGEEVYEEIERLVYTALRQIRLAKETYWESSNAAETLENVYEKQKLFYVEGRVDFANLLQTKRQLQAATLSKIQANASLQILRANLLRMNLEGLFGKISRCHASELEYRRLTKLIEARYSVEQICEISR